MTNQTEVVDLPDEDEDESSGGEMFGAVELRHYQVTSRNMLADALERNIKRILIKQPTATGKTITIAASLAFPRIRAALGVNNNKDSLRVLFIAHKHILLTQAERTFTEECNVELIIHSAFQPIPALIEWDVVVIDEAHHEAMMSIQYQLDRIGEKVIIGLTATDERADGSLLKFEEVIEPITREQAVAEGWICRTNLFSFLDVPQRDKTQLICDILEPYHHLMGNTLIFVRTKSEARAITRFIQDDLGLIAAAMVDVSSREQQRILDQFEAGNIQFIVNCGMIGEGADTKRCQTVLIGRQLSSYVLLNQLIGRSARIQHHNISNVIELINPLSAKNLETTCVVGVPEKHLLIHRQRNQWTESEFNYVSEQYFSF